MGATTLWRANAEGLTGMAGMSNSPLISSNLNKEHQQPESISSLRRTVHGESDSGNDTIFVINISNTCAV